MPSPQPPVTFPGTSRACKGGSHQACTWAPRCACKCHVTPRQIPLFRDRVYWGRELEAYWREDASYGHAGALVEALTR